MNSTRDPNTVRNTIILTITVLVVLALLIFSVYKVFSSYPFTLPSYIAFYIVVLTLFVFFFPLTRTYLEYRTLKFLAEADKDEFKAYVGDFLNDSENSEDSIIAVKGEVRLVIALTIILILGIALFQLMATTGFDDFVKSILAVFTGAITAIIGFYFGSKASKEGGVKTRAEQKGTEGSKGRDVTSKGIEEIGHLVDELARMKADVAELKSKQKAEQQESK